MTGRPVRISASARISQASINLSALWFAQMGSESAKPRVGYGEFGRWYDGYRATVLEPALTGASVALTALLADALSDRDQTRINTVSGRVKSKRRTWRKLRLARYQKRIQTSADIPRVIDDLVGMRITCTNLQDIEMVQAVLETLPRERRKSSELWIDQTSERDYVEEPKESGYRGWHVNLETSVNIDDADVPVTCELQVRTLLQDSWGQLTHEDTYSKDGALPPLIEVLSKRMADLFATLDDIAEDLRTELDRIDEAAIAESSPPAIGRSGDTSGEQAADAATVLLDRWTQLDRPLDLASLAWELQREFGAEISDEWFGHRSFKQFLLHSVPDGELSTGPNAYLMPPVYAPADDPDEPSTVPAAAHELRRVDRGFPLLESQEWAQLFGQLSNAWVILGEQDDRTSSINQLSRAARDLSEESGAALARRHFDYVAKATITSANSKPLTPAEIRELFVAFTVQRMIDLHILDPDHRSGRRAVEQWLSSGELAGR